MQSSIGLLFWELKIQNKVQNLSKYLLAFFLFCALTITLINKQPDVSKFGIIFAIIYMPLALIGFTHLIFKQDVEDGSLEFLLSNFTILQIIITKFIAIVISAFVSIILSLPVIYIIFNLDFKSLCSLAAILLTLLFISSALLILIASIQSYFRSNTNIISLLIMPLLMPSIVLAGLALQNQQNFSVILIMLGLDLIMVPISLILSAYLIKNIYNR